MPGHCLGYLSEPLESRRAVPPPCVRPQVAAEDEATAHAAVQSIDDMVLDAHNYDASIKLGGTILRRQLLLLLKVTSSGCLMLA